MTTGMDLKVERIRARVTIGTLAAEMDLSRQRISQIEATAVVTPETAQRYRDALQVVVQAAIATSQPAAEATA